MTPESCLESADKIRCRVNGLGTYRHSDCYADMHDHADMHDTREGRQTEERKSCSTEERVKRGGSSTEERAHASHACHVYFQR